jgi:hypothetical protein
MRPFAEEVYRVKEDIDAIGGSDGVKRFVIAQCKKRTRTKKQR